jgi:hypothetical protein
MTTLKSFLALAIFFSVSVSQAQVLQKSIYCSVKDSGKYDFLLRSEGGFDVEETELQVDVLERNEVVPEELIVSAKILKGELFDETEETNCGLGGCWTTFRRVFAVKLHMESNLPIAHRLSGCIMDEVNDLEAYATCFEAYSIRKSPAR